MFCSSAIIWHCLWIHTISKYGTLEIASDAWHRIDIYSVIFGVDKLSNWVVRCTANVSYNEEFRFLRFISLIVSNLYTAAAAANETYQRESTFSLRFFVCLQLALDSCYINAGLIALISFGMPISNSPAEITNQNLFIFSFYLIISFCSFVCLFVTILHSISPSLSHSHSLHFHFNRSEKFESLIVA